MPTENQDFSQQEKLAKELNYFFCENKQALDFALQIVYIFHLWDDLHDGDKFRTVPDVDIGFEAALIYITNNPFYLEHIHELQPLIANTILQWHIANNLEISQNQHEQEMAWMNRAAVVQNLFLHCAYLTGGWDWAKKVGPDIQKLYQEKLQDFLNEMNGGKNA